MAQFPQSFGTAFAVAGFSFDPNLSPNNQSFANAVLATVQRAGLPFGFEAANVVLAGPASGAAALPTYRALVTADVPAVGTLSTSAFANPTNKVSGTATNGTSTLAMRSDGAPALDWAQSPTWTGNHIFNPASGTPLLVQVGGVTGFQVVNTSSLAARGPVAGALVDMTPDSGSFVGTFGGFIAAPTATAFWVRNGNAVTILIPFGTGSSNSTNKNFAPIPAAITPVRLQDASIPYISNNNATVLGGGSVRIQTTGTLNFFPSPGISWAGSGAASIGISGVLVAAPYSLA